MTSRRVALPGGGTLAYRVRDEARGATPLLLIRPLGGSMMQWGRFADLLAAEHQLIVFDARGSGASSGPRVPTTTRSMAGDVIALLDHLGLAAIDVFGLSLGGMVATRLAIDAPTRVRRLVLASTVARGRATKVTESVRGARRGLALARCFLREEHAASACLVRRTLSPELRRARPDEVERIVAPFAAEGLSRVGAIAQVLAAAAHDARSELVAIRAPTLVLHGDRDHLLTRESQRALAAAIAGARFEQLPDAGHDLTLEQPVATAARVARFCLAGA